MSRATADLPRLQGRSFALVHDVARNDRTTSHALLSVTVAQRSDRKRPCLVVQDSDGGWHTVAYFRDIFEANRFSRAFSQLLEHRPPA